MVNINKRIKDFSLSANLGWSYSNYWLLERGYKGTLLGVTNDFNAVNIDPANGRISEKEVIAVCAIMLFCQCGIRLEEYALSDADRA